MHPSQSNNNCSYNTPPIPFSENDISSSFPRLSDPLFNFPNSPHDSTHHSDYEAVYLHFYDLLYAHHSADTIPAPKSTKKLVPEEPVITKKRCSKKDRHSKINTMHGPRDRRMRLSLDVARKFFNLQDLLGFDKPSKTVDWLLKSSGTAIAELEGGRRGLDPLLLKSSNSESCEEVMSSGVDNLSAAGSITVEMCSEKTPLMSVKKKKEKKIKATIARESRIKARARARERTSQKRRQAEETVVNGLIKYRGGDSGLHHLDF